MNDEHQGPSEDRPEPKPRPHITEPPPGFFTNVRPEDDPRRLFLNPRTGQMAYGERPEEAPWDPQMETVFIQFLPVDAAKAMAYVAAEVTARRKRGFIVADQKMVCVPFQEDLATVIFITMVKDWRGGPLDYMG